MKVIKLFSQALLLFLAFFTVAVAATSFTRAFTQVDTLIKPMVSPDSETIRLMQLSAEKTKDYNAQKDSVSQNLDFGTMKDKANRVNTTLQKTQSNLKEAQEKDATMIEKIYRIDTSPRPVIINVSFPVQATAPVKKGFFRRRD